MTKLLIRLFIRQPDNAQDPRVRSAYAGLASVVGMVCNLLLCLGKLAVGTLFGSIAITADALNNLSDASSNVVSLVGFKLASKARTPSIPSAMPGTNIWRALWSASPSLASAFRCSRNLP